LGGVVVFAGSGVSVYFAGYSGDQGGISALFFSTGRHCSLSVDFNNGDSFALGGKKQVGSLIGFV